MTAVLITVVVKRHLLFRKYIRSVVTCRTGLQLSKLATAYVVICKASEIIYITLFLDVTNRALHPQIFTTESLRCQSVARFQLPFVPHKCLPFESSARFRYQSLFF